MERIEPRQAAGESASGNLYMLDVRSAKAFEQATEHIPGDHRFDPDHLQEWSGRIPTGMHVVAYCT